MLFFYFILFFSSHLLCSFAPIFLSPFYSRHSDPGHTSCSCTPLPTAVFVCIIFPKRFQFFLPSWTRVELCLPTVGALSSWSFFIFANKFKISPREDSNSPTKSSNIRGLPPDYRSDRLEVEHNDDKVLLQKKKLHGTRVSML